MIAVRRLFTRRNSKLRFTTFCLAALLLPLAFLAAAPSDDEADPALKAALVAAAEKTYQAYQTAQDVGRHVDLAQMYVWSRRWLDAELLDADAEQRKAAAQRHLDRMNRLYRSVEPRFARGQAGGEAESFHAAQYYVAEAELLLQQAKR